jgi:large subunit ribosomal protein L18
LVERRNEGRLRRHKRVRKKVYGFPQRLRLSVYRSLNHIYAQVVNDSQGHTLVAASSLDKEIKERGHHKGNAETAKLVGNLVAKRALEKGIKKLVFDKSGYRYHGTIKILADAVREAGLEL